MKEIQMVDLVGQYQKIKEEVDLAIHKVIYSSQFINGPQVKSFQKKLEQYLGVEHVIPCANGTDALMVAFMALDLPVGSEVIVPTFNYVAAIEVIVLLKLKPVFIDVDPKSYNLDLNQIEEKITSKTKAILPVHLFGQCADMEPILEIAKKHNLFVIEDAAQAIGAYYTFSTGEKRMAGTMGDIGTTSFFPTKNLGCFGDGGAIYTNDGLLADKLRKIATHGQKEKYIYEMVGVNSRLDTLQAAILEIKLDHLDKYTQSRIWAAQLYDKLLADMDNIVTPFKVSYSDHVYHQYCIIIENRDRSEIKTQLQKYKIPTMVYYPSPIHLTKAYEYLTYQTNHFPVAESLSKKILALPMHSELDEEQIHFICNTFREVLP